MDFTQHNKINSSLPGPSALPVRYGHCTNSVHSKFSPQLGVQYSGGGRRRSYMPVSMASQSFDQHHSNRYSDEALETHPDVDNNGNQVDINFEYYQSSPQEAPFNHQRNLFDPVIESMKQFNKSSLEKAQHSNHQTVFHKHRDDDEDEQTFGTTNLRQQKTYKSHTRIVAIPNGVKIITEILNSEEAENDSGSSSSQSRDENWTNKQIEVSVENDNDHGLCNDSDKD